MQTIYFGRRSDIQPQFAGTCLVSVRIVSVHSSVVEVVSVVSVVNTVVDIGTISIRTGVRRIRRSVLGTIHAGYVIGTVGTIGTIRIPDCLELLLGIGFSFFLVKSGGTINTLGTVSTICTIGAIGVVRERTIGTISARIRIGTISAGISTISSIRRGTISSIGEGTISSIGRGTVGSIGTKGTNRLFLSLSITLVPHKSVCMVEIWVETIESVESVETIVTVETIETIKTVQTVSSSKGGVCSRGDRLSSIGSKERIGLGMSSKMLG